MSKLARTLTCFRLPGPLQQGNRGNTDAKMLPLRAFQESSDFQTLRAYPDRKKRR